MKELIRTNDLILISRIESILNDANIQYELFDAHTSIIEGSIDIISKRIVVSNIDYSFSKKLVQDLTNDNENK